MRYNLEKDFPTIYKWVTDGYKLRVVLKRDIVGVTKENFEPDEYELALIKEDDWSWCDGETLYECLQNCEEDLIKCEELNK